VSATKLLVLGTVRIFQPAHGYLVRRELLSWGVEEWAAVNPGSIYNMLRSLTRDQLLAEVDVDGPGRGPAKVGYRLTMDGEIDFLGSLTRALWEIDDRDWQLLPAALCFLPMLTRAQAVEALEARATALELKRRAIDARGRLLVEQRLAPPHTAELLDVESAYRGGELDWVRRALDRIGAGYYRFADDPGAAAGPVDGHWYGPLEKTT
jgi:DNA-binding PadR family transcriptional regulator